MTGENKKDEALVMLLKLQQGVEYGFPRYLSDELDNHVLDILGEYDGMTWDLEESRKLMSKSKAIEFTKKYLADRRDQYVKCSYCGEPLNDKHGKLVSCKWDLERAKKESVTARPWDCAVEYVLLDIIPHIYGEALDFVKCSSCRKELDESKTKLVYSNHTIKWYCRECTKPSGDTYIIPNFNVGGPVDPDDMIMATRDYITPKLNFTDPDDTIVINPNTVFPAYSWERSSRDNTTPDTHENDEPNFIKKWNELTLKQRNEFMNRQGFYIDRKGKQPSEEWKNALINKIITETEDDQSPEEYVIGSIPYLKLITDTINEQLVELRWWVGDEMNWNDHIDYMIEILQNSRMEDDSKSKLLYICPNCNQEREFKKLPDDKLKCVHCAVLYFPNDGYM